MFPLVAAELGDFLIKGMREFVFLGGVAFTRWMHLFESREEWPAQRDGKGMAKRGRWREIDGERAGGEGRKEEEEEEGARISMMINASCEGT